MTGKAMRICIVGAGAIGSLLGVKLAKSGQEVSFIDRGEQLAAIQSEGLTLRMTDGSSSAIDKLNASDNCHDLGSHDLIILALKAHQIRFVAEHLGALMSIDTVVMTVQNGLPWWYFQKHKGELNNLTLNTLDPTGSIKANIDADRIIGCVAYAAASVGSPGVVDHIEGSRFTLGELNGEKSERCNLIAAMLVNAGLKSYVVEDIRAEIWLKAWGSLSFNSISALTRATMVDICRFSDTRKLAENMMLEAQTIANKLGVEFRHSIAKRIAGAESVGPHKTSMLQDVEAKRELEIDALIGSILELATLTDTPAPIIETVYACIKLLNNELKNTCV